MNNIDTFTGVGSFGAAVVRTPWTLRVPSTVYPPAAPASAGQLAMAAQDAIPARKRHAAAAKAVASVNRGFS